MNINYLLLTTGTIISSLGLIISILDFSFWMMYVTLFIVGFITAMTPSLFNLEYRNNRKKIKGVKK